MSQLYSKTGDVTTEVEVYGKIFARIAVNCPGIEPGGDVAAFAGEYLPDHLRPDDVLVLSSGSLSASRGRFYGDGRPVPSREARIYSRLLGKKDRSGFFADDRCIQAALLVCGPRKILFAAACRLIERLFKKKGFFRKHVDQNLALVRPGRREMADCIILPPGECESLAAAIADRTGARTVICDPWGFDGKAAVLSCSDPYLSVEEIEEIMADAPMMIYSGSTPFCIIREKV